MRVALLCDIDQSVYHVGDEAIALATKSHLENLGHEVHMVSQGKGYGPAHSHHQHTLRGFEFPWLLEDRLRYLGEVRDVLSGNTSALPQHDKVHEIIAQMQSIDALIIGGGGALNSRYPWLMYERLAYALVARSLGIPVVLSGQSLGPDLAHVDREVLAELLELCALVGVRDSDSYRLAQQLAPNHAALTQICDDATLLLAHHEPFTRACEAKPRNVVSATFAADTFPIERGDFVILAAEAVGRLATRTGASVELIPHMQTPGTTDADRELHVEIAAALAERFGSVKVSVPHIDAARTSANRTAESAYVVASRFHPIVFGALAGRSVLPLGLNSYGRSRIEGALANVGLAGAVTMVDGLWDFDARTVKSTELDSVLDAVQHARDEQQVLQRGREHALRATLQWWDAVQQVLSGTESDAGEPAAEAPALPATAQMAELHQRQEAESAPARVGVIIRTKNRPILLDRALQDLANQTYRGFRVVIVNDGGDPETLEHIVERHRAAVEYGTEHPIEVLSNAQSVGMEAASNLGVAAAKGCEFLAVHDDDDTWHPLFLRETVNFLDAHPEHEAVHTTTEILEERAVGEGFQEYNRFRQEAELNTVSLVDFMKHNRMVPISLLYRARLHERVGFFREDLPVAGDYAFHLAILQKYSIGRIARPLAYWHHRPQVQGGESNSMFSGRDKHRYYDAILRDEHFVPWVQENGLGLPLFINKAVERESDRVIAHLEGTISRLERRIEELDRRLDQRAYPGEVVRTWVRAGKDAAKRRLRRS